MEIETGLFLRRCIHETKWRSTEQVDIIEDTQSRDTIYIATSVVTIPPLDLLHLLRNSKTKPMTPSSQLNKPPAIGIIGLWLMGRAQVVRLCQSGFTVRGLDTDAICSAAFIALGGELADNANMSSPVWLVGG